MEGFKHILYRANEKVRNILEKWPCNGASLVAQLIESPPAMQETWIWSLAWEDPLEKETVSHSSSGLEDSMDCVVHEVAKSRTGLSDFHFYFQWLSVPNFTL